MARRYRNFRRVALTANTAKKMVEFLVDPPLRDHYRNCSERPDCYHIQSGALGVARLIESNIHIGKKRAHFDIPDEEIVFNLAIRLRMIANAKITISKMKRQRRGLPAGKGPPTAAAFLRIADIAEKYANRSPLEKLAEAGVELD